MTPVEVGDLTEEAGRRGRVLGVRLPVVEDEDEAPWLAPPSRRKPDASITGPLPETVEVVLSDQVYVDRTGLVLVHRRQLLDQWVARLGSFLDQRPEQIGRIGGGKRGPTGVIDVAVIQSLVRKGEVDDIVADYGHLVVDECHHVSAVSFEAVARRCKARYVLGLSATATRKDGHHPIIFMQCGPVRFRVDARRQAAKRSAVGSCSAPRASRCRRSWTPIDRPSNASMGRLPRMTSATS